jgi:sec-independent protein translocase protein TatC
MDEKRGKDIPLIEHIKELRSRIIWILGVVICTSVLAYCCYNEILAILYRPFEILETENGAALYATSLFEGFMVRFKISLLAGVIFALPVILYHVIKFIVPALQAPEKRFLAWWLAAAGIMIIGGILYSYYGIVPLCVKFMTASEFIPSQVGLLLNFEQNIFYILQFILVIALVFQLPIILVVLMAMNILSRAALLKSGRYAIVLFFIIGAIITPPDVISQISVAVPLIALFYISIGVAKFFNWGTR